MASFNVCLPEGANEEQAEMLARFLKAQFPQGGWEIHERPSYGDEEVEEVHIYASSYIPSAK